MAATFYKFWHPAQPGRAGASIAITDINRTFMDTENTSTALKLIFSACHYIWFGLRQLYVKYLKRHLACFTWASNSLPFIDLPCIASKTSFCQAATRARTSTSRSTHCHCNVTHRTCGNMENIANYSPHLKHNGFCLLVWET